MDWVHNPYNVTFAPWAVSQGAVLKPDFSDLPLCFLQEGPLSGGTQPAASAAARSQGAAHSIAASSSGIGGGFGLTPPPSVPGYVVLDPSLILESQDARKLKTVVDFIASKAASGWRWDLSVMGVWGLITYPRNALSFRHVKKHFVNP